MKGIDDRHYSRDAIERFLDRSWVYERTPIDLLRDYRIALSQLDGWMQRHRAVTLSTAGASDVRALLDSPCWIESAQRCPTLLGAVTAFYQGLQDCKFRPDDPVETLVDQELFAAVIKHDATRRLRDAARRTSLA